MFASQLLIQIIPERWPLKRPIGWKLSLDNCFALLSFIVVWPSLCNLVQDAWAGLGWWPDVYSGESRWVAAWQESRNTLQASAVTVFSSCVRITITAASINTHTHSFCGISIDIKFSYVLYLRGLGVKLDVSKITSFQQNRILGQNFWPENSC